MDTKAAATKAAATKDEATKDVKDEDSMKDEDSILVPHAIQANAAGHTVVLDTPAPNAITRQMAIKMLLLSKTACKETAAIVRHDFWSPKEGIISKVLNVNTKYTILFHLLQTHLP